MKSVRCCPPGRARAGAPRPRLWQRLRAAALAAALATTLAGCGDMLVPDPRPSAPVQLFDQVWSDVDQYYAHFQTSGVDWDAVRARYRPLAATAPDDQHLADAIAGMLGELRDPHVTLYTPFRTYEDTSCYRPGGYNSVATARYLSGAVTDAHMVHALVGADIGYIRIPSFAGEDWAGEIDGVLAQLGDVRGLVVDVRANGGGVDVTANAIADRFVDRETTAEYVRYRSGPGHDQFSDFYPITVAPTGHRFAGSVALLTDRRDFSAAEQFVLFMRASPRVRVVGDTTGGASGRPLTRELANGWAYRFSTWIAYTPDRRPYEGIGLAPDVVARPVAGDAARVDRALESALAFLKPAP